MEDRSRSPPRGNVNTEAWGILRKKLHPGAKARLKGLNVQRNGELVVLQDFYPTSGRWRVKLRSGHLKDLKPEHLVFEAPADSPPRPIHEELPIPVIVQEPPKPPPEEKPNPQPQVDQSSKEGELRPGCKVTVQGLKSALDLNGQEGILDSFKPETGRWRIKLNNGQMKDLKANNLAAVVEEKVPREEPAKQIASETLLAEMAALNAELNLGGSQTQAEQNVVPATFEVKPGDKCGPEGRFTVLEKLGEGDYSMVWRCKDIEHGMDLAIKFTRDNPEMRFALEREVKILGDLFEMYGKKDPEGIRSILSLAFFEGFEHNGGFGVAFEMMKCNLRTALEKYGKGRGLPLLPTVRNFGKNIFSALRLLREADLLHCDVKPENLLLTKDNESVKLSDFGIAMRMSERRITDQMQPRHYRAPEVILGQEYNTQIDVWSAGATLYELATDRVLFVGGTNNEMLHEMLKVVGAFPKAYSATGKFALNHFHANSDFLNAKGDMALNSSNPRVIPIARFDPPMRPIPWLLEDLQKQPPRGVPLDRHQGLVAHLIDLLGRCLLPDPASRVPPGIALAHRFFQKGA